MRPGPDQRHVPGPGPPHHPALRGQQARHGHPDHRRRGGPDPVHGQTAGPALPQRHRGDRRWARDLGQHRHRRPLPSMERGRQPGRHDLQSLPDTDGHLQRPGFPPDLRILVRGRTKRGPFRHAHHRPGNRLLLVRERAGSRLSGQKLRPGQPHPGGPGRTHLLRRPQRLLPMPDHHLHGRPIHQPHAGAGDLRQLQTRPGRRQSHRPATDEPDLLPGGGLHRHHSQPGHASENPDRGRIGPADPDLPGIHQKRYRPLPAQPGE